MSDRRENYALAFWLEEPRSANVVLKTDVVPDNAFPFILPGQVRKVTWGNKAYPARILMTGKLSRIYSQVNLVSFFY